MGGLFLLMSESNVANYVDDTTPYECEKNHIICKYYLNGSMITTSKLIAVNLMSR